MKIYLGTFLIAFATLALEIALTRLLSVITWYHLAFFAISTAMLGMTAGATTVYLRPKDFSDDKIRYKLGKTCFLFAVSIPLSLIIICLVPIITLRITIMTIFSFLILTTMCSLPFYYFGIVITVILTKIDLPIGKLYASDLIGASLGCLFVLLGLEILDAQSFIISLSIIGMISGLCFFEGNDFIKYRRIAFLAIVIVISIMMLNMLTTLGVKPLMVKNIRSVYKSYLEKWNSFSRVTVTPKYEGPPQYWGPSPLAPMDIRIPQYGMSIDGEAGTVLRRFSGYEDIDHLRFDVTNLAYYLRPNGGACIIGVGGGRDVHSAILFGHEFIDAIDINPIFIKLLKNQLKEFAGIDGRPGVNLIIDEARSHLSRSIKKYAVIQMSLIDTWAATGAGAFSLSENVLYTIEAWNLFLNRLTNDGIFTVSRWFNPKNIGETGRMASLAVASLLDLGFKNPSEHIAIIATNNLATLLISKRPFTNDELISLRKKVIELQYDSLYIPNNIDNNKLLSSIISVNNMNDLLLNIKDMPINVNPPTDETPYFFNMLKLGNIKYIFEGSGSGHTGLGVLKGNLLATITLLILIFSLAALTVITIILPLLLKGEYFIRGQVSEKVFWSGAMYFSLIGAGFMFLEIALLQRLSVFLSHPIYSLGIVLFTIIASTGLGSFVSEYVPLDRYPWIYIYPVVMVVAIIATCFVLPYMIDKMINYEMIFKIIASIFVIFPSGVLLGCFFPTGMRIVRRINNVDTPWYWALNGIFGVLCSAVAVFISIYIGISTNFYVAAVCYLLVIVSLYNLEKGHDKN